MTESSGATASRRHPGVVWTLDDSGPAVLHAVYADGRPRGRVEVPGGLGRDREALALGPCGAADCLYVADVGDNEETRTWLGVYRVPEPDPGDTLAAPPDLFRFALPDGPRDVEAIFLLPGERLHLVTKGLNHPPTVYRYPGSLGASPTYLREVQRLADHSQALPGRITDAAASDDGRIVLLRTYRSLRVHLVRGDSLVRRPVAAVDLLPLAEPQGEGVALLRDGRVVLTGEAGPLGRRGSIAVLRCRPAFFGSQDPGATGGRAPPTADPPTSPRVNRSAVPR